MVKQSEEQVGSAEYRARVSRRDVLAFGAAAGADLALSRPASAASVGYRIVETDHGKLRGSVADGLATFKGIPYGQSTAGPNRFLPPQPIAPWRGVRDALQLGHQSPQVNPDHPVWLDPSPMGEDCLVLNVWAPTHAIGGKALPVMVWLHGGAFMYGSAGATFYDGGSLALKGDVVVVGVNHRLNSFGYTQFGAAAGEQFAQSGNAGHLDLIAALKWVRANIAQLGGDADNITLFGESGGGAKISVLLATPSAQGLFHRAIIQSGSILRMVEPGVAEHATARVCDALGIRRGDAAALQQVPMHKLLRAGLSATQGSLLHYGPVNDGRVIPDQPWADGAPASSKDVPVLVGSNLHEAIDWIGADKGGAAEWLSKSSGQAKDDDMAIAQVASKFGVLNDYAPKAVLPVVAASRRAEPGITPGERLVRVSTSIGFWRNCVMQASLLSMRGGAPVYVYQCNWRTPCYGGMWAPHGIEMPFIFGHQKYGVAWDGQDSEAQRDAADPAGDRFRLGEKMLDAWLAFARTGNPSSEGLEWPAYDKNRRQTMIFDAQPSVVSDPHKEIRKAVTLV